MEQETPYPTLETRIASRHAHHTPQEITDAILREDSFFRSLATLNVAINYYHRTKVAGDRHYAEGTERDKNSGMPLFTATLFVDCPDIHLYESQPEASRNQSRDIIYNRPVRLVGPMAMDALEQKLVQEEGDGAYVAVTNPSKRSTFYISEGRHIISVNPTPLFKDLEQRYPYMKIETYADIYEFYLPPDFVRFSDKELPHDGIGSRTMHAMTVPIVLGGGRVYMIKQTVYDHGDIGKTVMFDKNGLAAEFFLASEGGLSDSLREGINEGSYFDADDRTVGVLRTYHPHDKFERQEYLVPPASLALGDAIMRSAMPYAASSDGKAIARVALAKVPASGARQG